MEALLYNPTASSRIVSFRGYIPHSEPKWHVFLFLCFLFLRRLSYDSKPSLFFAINLPIWLAVGDDLNTPQLFGP